MPEAFFNQVDNFRGSETKLVLKVLCITKEMCLLNHTFWKIMTYLTVNTNLLGLKCVTVKKKTHLPMYYIV